MASPHSFALPVQMPFDWESLLEFMRRRATPGVETVTESAYTRTITDGAGPQTLSVTYDPAGASLQIAYSGNAASQTMVESRAKQIFKTDVSTVPIETFLGRDKWLAGLLRDSRDCASPAAGLLLKLRCGPSWDSRSQCPLQPR
jgi:AraC family transcriptional regulator of adaptative response / DNA-3-methyladenine glycosylase II